MNTPIKLQVEGKYGKTKVRVLRVIRHDKSYHDLTEVDIECLLEGDLEDSYVIGDNANVVPTDTIKNTIYAFAEKTHFESIENLDVDGEPHDHVFSSEAETRTARTIGTRLQAGANFVGFEVISGVDNIKLLKTTQSGFEHYTRDEYTTLQPTKDRIFCTVVQAEWEYDTGALPAIFLDSNQKIKQILIQAFSGPPKHGEYSKSVCFCGVQGPSNG